MTRRPRVPLYVAAGCLLLLAFSLRWLDAPSFFSIGRCNLAEGKADRDLFYLRHPPSAPSGVVVWRPESDFFFFARTGPRSLRLIGPGGASPSAAGEMESLVLATVPTSAEFAAAGIAFRGTEPSVLMASRTEGVRIVRSSCHSDVVLRAQQTYLALLYAYWVVLLTGTGWALFALTNRRTRSELKDR